ncbi:hypothetical protein D3C75_659710 [compost metagenome]|jgi:hypothetical protein
MHSLNSIAGIRRYRIQDEMPNGFGGGMIGISPVSIDISLEKQQVLTEKPEGTMSWACNSLGRIASRIFSRWR